MNKRERRNRVRVKMTDGTLASGKVVRETAGKIAGLLIRVGRMIVWRDRQGRA